MMIRLHIERVIIDGLPLHGAQGIALRAALERELSRRFAEGPLDPKPLSGSQAFIRGATIPVDGPAPVRLGEQVAGSVHDSIRALKAGAQK